MKSYKEYRGAGGFRLWISKQVSFEVFLKVCTVWQDLMSDGGEFQARGAATENVKQIRSNANANLMIR